MFSHTNGLVFFVFLISRLTSGWAAHPKESLWTRRAVFKTVFCHSCRPAISVKSLKGTPSTNSYKGRSATAPQPFMMYFLMREEIHFVVAV